MPQRSQDEEKKLIAQVQQGGEKARRKAYDKLWRNYEADMRDFMQRRHIPEVETESRLSAVKETGWDKISSVDLSIYALASNHAMVDSRRRNRSDFRTWILDVAKRHDQKRLITIAQHGDPELNRLIEAARNNEPGAFDSLVANADSDESQTQNGSKAFRLRVERARKGDTKAFQTLAAQAVEKVKQNAFYMLWTDYQQAIRVYLVRRKVDENDTDAVMSEVEQKAWKAITTYEPPRGAFYTWLIKGPAKSVVADYFKKKNEQWKNEVLVPDVTDLADQPNSGGAYIG